jgi:hypothetical protein
VRPAKKKAATKRAAPAARAPSAKLAQRVGELARAAAAREKAAKALALAKEREDELSEAVAALLRKERIESAAFAVGTVRLDDRVYPNATDWDAIRDYVVDTGEWDLLEKRLAVLAFRERIEAGREVPGIAAVRVVKVKFSPKKKGA